MPDWDDLRILLSLCQTGSATSAARILVLDKGTVSRRIAGLEAALGTRLFDRRISGWTPTEAGRRAAEAARAMSGQIAALAADLGGLGTARTQVKLTLPLWFCTDVLLAHLPSLAARAPWLDLEVVSVSSVLNLGEREADVALRNRRPERGEFVVRKAGDLGSALYATHALARELHGPDDLWKVGLVGYGDSLAYVPEFMWLNRHLAKDARVLRLTDAKALEAAVAAGLGAAVLPCHLGDRNPGLTRLFGMIAHEQIWLVAPADVAQSRAVSVVLRFVAEVFRQNAASLRGEAIDVA